MKEARKARPHRQRRPRFSPATAIATLALLLALGGGAYAASTADSTVEWAVVSAKGRLVRGNGGIGATRIKQNGKPVPGLYQVLFFDDVRNCAYKATLGSTTNRVPPVGDVGVSKMPGVVNGVEVRTTNSKGDNAAESFHVAAIC